MARRILLSPQLVDGWLDSMVSKVERAAAANLDGIVEGRIEGALAVDKEGRALLVTKLAAEMDDAAFAALTGGLPVGVEGSIEIGWDQDSKLGRLVSGWCYARFATKDAARIAELERQVAELAGRRAA